MTSQQTICATLRGTFAYMSPELKAAVITNIRQPAYNPFISDVFSLGMTLLSMIRLQVFANITDDEQNPTMFNEEKLHGRIIAEMQYSERLKQVLKRMLTYDASIRPDFKELNRWLTELQSPNNSHGPIVAVPQVVDMERQLYSQLEAVLAEKWGIQRSNGLVCPTVYLKQVEMVELLGKYSAEAAAKAASFYFPYIPLSQVLSDFAQKLTPTLTVHISSTRLLSPIAQVSSSFGAYQPASASFLLRKYHNSVTISEPATYYPAVKVRLRPHQTYPLRNFQIYRFGKQAKLWVVAANPAQLILQTWDDAQTQYSFSPSQAPIFLGRNSTSHLRFPVETMSLEHAVIHWTGIWSIEDRGSSNGTWVFCHAYYYCCRESNEIQIENGTEVADRNHRYIVQLA